MNNYLINYKIATAAELIQEFYSFPRDILMEVLKIK